jgi:streptogramin lyase
MDKDPKTKGTSHLRIYNLTTGIIEKDIDLSSLAPKASAYFANDLTVDNEGNIYISDWYANLIYKVDTQGKASIFWENTSGIMAGPNGLDFHPDGYLLVSLIKVNDKGIYNKHGLIKIPLNNPKSATVVKITSPQFFGFDGMVIDTKGNVTGITNNQTSAGGNMLIELTSTNAWKSAQVTQAKAIKSSTTLAQTPNNQNYVINQDFKDNFAKTWTIQNIAF